MSRPYIRKNLHGEICFNELDVTNKVQKCLKVLYFARNWLTWNIVVTYCNICYVFWSFNIKFETTCLFGTNDSIIHIKSTTQDAAPSIFFSTSCAGTIWVGLFTVPY
jgi:hypothetical protein